MKPPPFEYAAPRKTDEALALLAQHGDRAKVLAGGQSLLPLLNFRLAQPEVLVDVNRVAELAYVRPANGGLAIGALTRQHALERSDAVRARLPIVAEACRLIGHLPIRHRGTLGGSLAHADPASELPAVMVALEAEMTASRVGQRRTLPADQFFTGIDPLGKIIRIGNEEFTVIGAFEKVGSVLGQDQDNFIIIPLSRFLRIRPRFSLTLNVLADQRSGSFQTAQDQVTVLMRSRRHVMPQQESDFFVGTKESYIDLWQSISSAFFTASKL